MILVISLLLFLQFIQSLWRLTFNISASLAACQHFQPVPYYCFFKCADSVVVFIAPLLWTDHVLKFGYKLTWSTNVFVFHGVHQNASCLCLMQILPFTHAAFILFSFIPGCFPSMFFNSSLPHKEYFNSRFVISTDFSFAILLGISCFEHFTYHWLLVG